MVFPWFSKGLPWNLGFIQVDPDSPILMEASTSWMCIPVIKWFITYTVDKPCMTRILYIYIYIILTFGYIYIFSYLYIYIFTYIYIYIYTYYNWVLLWWLTTYDSWDAPVVSPTPGIRQGQWSPLCCGWLLLLLLVTPDFLRAASELNQLLQDGAPKIAKLPYKWLYGRYNELVTGDYNGL